MIFATVHLSVAFLKGESSSEVLNEDEVEDAGQKDEGNKKQKRRYFSYFDYAGEYLTSVGRTFCQTIDL